MMLCISYPTNTAFAHTHVHHNTGHIDSSWSIVPEIMVGGSLLAYSARAGIPAVAGIPLVSTDLTYTAITVTVPLMAKQASQIHINSSYVKK